MAPPTQRMDRPMVRKAQALRREVMYIIVEDESPQRRIAYHYNVSHRHCRIGKVVIKRPKHWGKPIPDDPKDRFTFQWPQLSRVS